MTGFTFVTKRKLNKAIELAKADGKFKSLNPADFKTVLWGSEAYLFHAAGYFARINTRSDGTIFISWVEKCNPDLNIVNHTI